MRDGQRQREKLKCGGAKNRVQLFSQYSSDFSISGQYADDDDSTIVDKERCMICDEFGNSEMWYTSPVADSLMQLVEDSLQKQRNKKPMF